MHECAYKANGLVQHDILGQFDGNWVTPLYISIDAIFWGHSNLQHQLYFMNALSTIRIMFTWLMFARCSTDMMHACEASISIFPHWKCLWKITPSHYCRRAQWSLTEALQHTALDGVCCKMSYPLEVFFRTTWQNPVIFKRIKMGMLY